jgi:hypothetical protein
VRLTIAIAALLFLTGFASPEQDEVFPREELITGKVIDRSACALMKHAVWVEHAHGTECIRYYASLDLQGAKQAVFYFHGDRLDGARPANSTYRDNSVRAQLRSANVQAKRFGVPFVMVARPGVYGSSGRHGERRHAKEFHSLNAALDAIKARHGIQSVVLTGQSGGGTVVGALLTLGREDVSCAVGTSGPYETLAHVGAIHTDPRRRVFIIGDPRDQQTPFPQQREFAERVRRAGHSVTLVEAQAGGRAFHDLRSAAYLAAALCAKGAATDQIVKAVVELGPRR